MKISDFEINWPKSIALIALTILLFIGHSCAPETLSLVHPGEKVTRPELQIELTAIMSTAEIRMADLDRQEAFRDLIFKNALVIVETGTLNPLGIITLLTGLYGITRGAQDIKKKVKKNSNNS